jgi:hypothetical protein
LKKAVLPKKKMWELELVLVRLTSDRMGFFEFCTEPMIDCSRCFVSSMRRSVIHLMLYFLCNIKGNLSFLVFGSSIRSMGKELFYTFLGTKDACFVEWST